MLPLLLLLLLLLLLFLLLLLLLLLVPLVLEALTAAASAAAVSPILLAASTTSCCCCCCCPCRPCCSSVSEPHPSHVSAGWSADSCEQQRQGQGKKMRWAVGWSVGGLAARPRPLELRSAMSMTGRAAALSALGGLGLGPHQASLNMLLGPGLLVKDHSATGKQPTPKRRRHRALLPNSSGCAHLPCAAPGP